MSVPMFVIRHPNQGYFTGFQRTAILSRFTFKARWGKEPVMNWYVTSFSTREEAEAHLVRWNALTHDKVFDFPVGALVVEVVIG